jgi:uncharacterized surface protein with fasciclin (FAS1) repeats
MKKATLVAMFSVVMAFCLLAGYVGTEAKAGTTTNKTIVQIAQETPELSTLVTAVETAGLVDALNGPGPFTVFAPTNDAFAKLDPSLLQKLLTSDVATLKQILLYHVAAGEVTSSQLENGQQITTLQGEKVLITIECNGVFINNAMVVIKDIQACNGVIHVIDAVLIPPSPAPVCP